MFRLKICGVTQAADMPAIVAAGADAIGLNFFSQSKRFLDLAAAEKVRAAASGASATVVGVFVNSSPEEIRRFAQHLSLDLVQLHGDEPPRIVAELEGLSILRAFRCRREDAPRVLDYLEECRSLGAQIAGVLLDAWQPQDYGGTGAVGDWKLAAELARQIDAPVVLAGGLTPENVAQAIAATGAAAVDVASGVESAPGIKDPEKVRRFIAAAKAAWDLSER